ncbi:MAG: hypothetical protein KKA73_18545 [Chloroflexi bacterium]|nr:hypothetical protein [Chloroflexota bacterium]MBU1749688.1 hypothetical protein [Chloroflexota bacterium]
MTIQPAWSGAVAPDLMASNRQALALARARGGPTAGYPAYQAAGLPSPTIPTM